MKAPFAEYAIADEPEKCEPSTKDVNDRPKKRKEEKKSLLLNRL
jgi:hypothetical protein